MVNKTILSVKYKGKKFFVLAKPFEEKNTIRHLDSTSKRHFDSKEVGYMLFAIRNAKLTNILGFIDNIYPGEHSMKIYIKTTCDSPKTFEYETETVNILQEIYRIS